MNIFPSSLEILEFAMNFNQPINPGVLPRSLKKLEFSSQSQFKQPIQPGWLPEGIEELSIYSLKFQLPLISGIFPSGLKKLILDCELKESIAPRILPSNLNSLTFGKYFDKPILSNSLPSELKSLTFESSNYFPLFPSILPESLEKLEFNKFFFPIPPEFLPPKLNSTFLYYGGGYNDEFESEEKIVSFNEMTKISHKIEIPNDSTFRIIENMKWNKNIYLIEIIHETKEKKLKTLSWNQLLICGNDLKTIRISENEKDSSSSSSSDRIPPSRDLKTEENSD